MFTKLNTSVLEDSFDSANEGSQKGVKYDRNGYLGLESPSNIQSLFFYSDTVKVNNIFRPVLCVYLWVTYDAVARCDKLT